MIKQILLLTFSALLFADNNSSRCHRNLYLGSPVNTIHKAHEYIEHLLQLSNTKSKAFYIGGAQTTNQNTGDTYHDYLFRLDEDGERYSMPKALIMRVAVSGSGNTFVDDVVLMEGPNGLGDVNDKLNWFLANRYGLSDYRNKFFNLRAFKDCTLIKESFTYFYEMYGERFRKSLNQFQFRILHLKNTNLFFVYLFNFIFNFLQDIMKQTLYTNLQSDQFLQSCQLNNIGQYTLQSELYLHNTSNNTFVKFQAFLKDSNIFLKFPNEQNFYAKMDINYSFMKVITKLNEYNQKLIGIKFFKHNFFEEIYFNDRQTGKKWFDYCKQYCILVNFRHYFDDIKVLGTGNFAKVYLVNKKSNNKKFAVKVFDKKLFELDPQEKDCILQEIQMMKVIDHIRLQKTYEIYEGDNHIYCVSQYYNGRNLLNYLIDDGLPTEKFIINISKQILQGLSYLSSKNIIHRDIKPENILFTNEKENQIVVVDYGFATYEKDYQKLFARCGTPGFVAPEVLNDEQYNSKIDVYSCGIIMYLMLSGDIPFSGNSQSEIVEQNIEGYIDYKCLESFQISSWLIQLLQRMLKKDKQKRITASEALSIILQQQKLQGDQPMHKEHKVSYSKVNQGQEIASRRRTCKKALVQEMNNRTEDLSVSRSNKTLEFFQEPNHQSQLSLIMKILQMADNFEESLRSVLNNAKYSDNLARGLHEVCKALESQEKPALCILAEDCQEAKYKQLITALCKEKGVSLVKVDQRVALGEWVGLCKVDETGTARKIRGCSSVAVRKVGSDDDAAMNIIKQRTV